jgi:hypothetical protein
MFAYADDPMENHPMWMTAQEWLDSPYHKQWNPDGKFTVLFDIGRNQSNSDVFPIYPAAELMIRVQDGWCYQPYGCRCESTKSDSRWVYVKVTDFSYDLDLKSIREHIEREISYYKYSRYNWSRKGRKAFDELGIDFTAFTSDGEESCRSSVTHQELQRILEVPELREVWEEAQETALKTLSWYKETPSKETPVKIYAAGSDDASYTKLYDTLDQAMQDVERFKVEGMPEHPESEDWVFTN